jgi:glycosyltransferase involved in cell wall biosynthesis
VALIANGIATPPEVSGAPFFEAFPELRSRRLVLFMGRIHPKKGLDPLCRAWAAVVRDFPEAILVIAGPDEVGTQASLDALVTRMGINAHVKFVGLLTGDMKWSALKAADVFTLPSFSEGFSVAILEAMGMGTPVLVSRQCNFPEVRDNDCGIVIEPQIGEIEDALRELLKAPLSRLDEMGANGKALIKSLYSWTTIGSQMADVYDWMLGGAKPSTVEIFD